MMGLTASDTVRISTSLNTHISGVGTNCGVGAAEVIVALQNLSSASATLGVQPALVAKANCGIPKFVDGEISYDGTPELMAEYAVLAMNSGASIIGGCCGTTPAHVAAMRQAIDSHLASSAGSQPSPPTLETIEAKLGEVSTGAKAQLSGDLSVAGGSASGRGARLSRRRRR